MNLLRHLLKFLLRLFGIGRTNDFRACFTFDSVSAEITRFMGFDFHPWRTDMSTLDITIGDTGTHTATLVCSNIDGTHAPDVTITYSSDNPAVCAVDAATGALTIASVGTCTITGTGVRGAFSHSDSGAVTVAQGDFTAALTLV